MLCESALVIASASPAAKVRNGGTSSSTSSMSQIMVAPSRMRRLLPLCSGRSMGPGRTSTSWPSSLANRAVIREPERSPASMTKVARPSAATIRLRRRKRARAWRSVPWQLRYNRTVAIANPLRQSFMFCRVQFTQARTNHSHGTRSSI